MTLEEITKTIEQMLAVQRQIQESQIRNTDNIARLEMQVEANAQQIENTKNLLQESIRSNRENISILVEEISKLAVEIKKRSLINFMAIINRLTLTV